MILAKAKALALPSFNPDFKRRHWLVVFGLAYVLAIYALGGIQNRHVIMGLSIAFLAAYNEKTRHFLKYFFPFLLTGIAYDSMRYYYWWGIEGNVRVAEPYLYEKALFGINMGDKVLTPNEYWQLNTNKVLDFFCGFAYLSFVFEYLGAGFVLYFARHYNLLKTFGWCFLLLNIMGFATYYIYPAAPPWYVEMYGMGPAKMFISSTPAGAARFDALFGTHFFDGMYGQSIDVYGAFPSLHVAYPLLVAWVAFQSKRGRVAATAFFLLMCFSAIYLNHHYIIDVILGVLYSCAALALTRWVLARKKSNAAELAPSMAKAGVCILICLLSATSATANEDMLFDITPSAVAPIRIMGFKRVPADEALNQIALELQAGGFEARGSVNGRSELKNLFLAFAVDVRYARNCAASKTSALCTFYHSSARINSHVGWTDLESLNRYEVIVVPVEYVTGYFGKAGPDLKTTSSALFASLGSRLEYLRDLGLGIERRVLATLTAALNYSSESNPLSATSGFRWIGSARIFGGCSSVGGESSEFCHGIAGGIESEVGLVFDLQEGAFAFTSLARLEGDIGLGKRDYRLGSNTNKLELKYSRPVCRNKQKGGCLAPRKFTYGGGVRYEYSTASYEHDALPDGVVSQDRAAHRIILFGELGRF